MADVDITFGADTSAAQAGLAELRTSVTSVMGAIRSEFAGAFAIGGITAAFTSLIEKLHTIHQESERFGLDAEQLQKIAIPAAEVGVSMEQVARAMNQAQIAGAKAAETGGKFAAALKTLNIDLVDFNNMSADKKIVAVAEAFEKSAKSAEDYAAVAQILGQRFGTELIPAFDAIIARSKEAGESFDVVSKAAVDAGQVIYQVWERVKQGFTVFASDTLLFFSDELRAWATFTVTAVTSTRDIYVAAFHSMQAAMHFDWAGVEAEMQKGFDKVKADAEANKKLFLQPGATPKTPPPTEDLTGLFGGGAGAGGGGGGAGGGSLEGFATLTEKALASTKDTIDAQDKLVSLTQERADLEKQLDEGIKNGTIDYYEQDALTASILTKGDEIAKVQSQITDETNAQALADQKAVDAINLKIQKARDEVAVQQLLNTGHEEEAHQLQITLDYNEKIQKAVDAATLAYQEGDTAIGDANTKLANQLEIDKNIALTEQARLDRSAAAVKASQNQGFGGISPTLYGAMTPEAQLNYLRSQQGAITNANLVGTGGFGDIRAIQSINLRTGQVNTEMLANLRQQDLLMSAYLAQAKTQQITPGGPGSSLGFFQQLALQQQLKAVAAFQTAQQQQSAQSYYQSLLTQQRTGTGAFAPGAISISGQPQPIVQTATSAGQATQISQLTSQINIMQQQLTTLQTISKNTTATAGTKAGATTT